MDFPTVELSDGEVLTPISQKQEEKDFSLEDLDKDLKEGSRRGSWARPRHEYGGARPAGFVGVRSMARGLPRHEVPVRC